MSEQTGSFSAPTETPLQQPPQPSTTEVAREGAANVTESVREAGGQVTQTATEQAKQVVEETREQARDLVGEARSQVQQQASTQQQKAAQTLRSLGDELQEMADKSGQSGLATELAQQAAERVRGLASWLEQREPGDLLDEVRAYARRRPGVFLFGAAMAGVVAGRLTRAVTAAAGGQPGQVRPSRLTPYRDVTTTMPPPGYGDMTTSVPPPAYGDVTTPRPPSYGEVTAPPPPTYGRGYPDYGAGPR